MGQQRNERAKLAADGNTKAWTEAGREPGMDPPAPSAVWVRILPSQVVRAVAVALSTAVVLLGAFFLLWRAPPPNVDARVGPGPRPAARGWAYKTDASGRPRHFFSHREAAWWAIRRVSAPFSPFLASSIL